MPVCEALSDIGCVCVCVNVHDHVCTWLRRAEPEAGQQETMMGTR